MRDVGFVQGVASPCRFPLCKRGIIASVHGDDFTVVGPKCQIDWFAKQLAAVYEMKCTGRLGAGPNDDKEMNMVNRVVRWIETGLEYEAGPRQAEKLIESFGLCD